eukprot:c28047_g1_i2 orf=510-2687(-)
MRISTSLLDFSAYGKVNVEDGTFTSGGKPFSSSLQLQEGGTAYSSKSRKASPNRFLPVAALWRPKLCWKVASVVLLMCTLVVIMHLSFQWRLFSWRPEKLQYAIVLDCGSTGTRVHVYAWAHKQSHASGQLSVVMHPTWQQKVRSGLKREWRAYQRMETEPGLDKLVNNESGMKVALEPLLQWAEGQIPSSAHRNTPLFLLATAGLRSLPSFDSEWLLDKAWTILEKSRFMCRRTWVKVISGVEEAYYGWVALNYNLGRLGHVPPWSTFGALDLGGSSLQVTFESEERLHSEYGLNLSVGSTEHHLYAYSHPGFGLNDAFDRSVALLHQQSDINMNDLARRHVLYHPCLHAGYKGLHNCAHCMHQTSPAGPYVTGAGAGKNKIEVELVGKPDWEACEGLARAVVNVSSFSEPLKCEVLPCALGKHQPESHGDFYALSGFFVVYKFFNLSHASHFEDLMEKGKNFCGKTWKVAQASVIPQPFVEQYCFRAPYIVALLQEGLHLLEEQIIVGSGNMTWTLGAALLEAGALVPSKLKNISPIKSSFNGLTAGPLVLNTGTLTVFFSLVLLVVIFIVAYFRQWIIQLWQKPYLPLFTQTNSNNNPPVWLPPMLRSPIRLGIGTGLNALRNGDGRYKMPHSPVPFGTTQGFYHQKIAAGSTLAGAGSPNSDSSGLHLPVVQGGLSFVAKMPNYLSTVKTPHKGNSQLQSRRTQSRDDLNLHAIDSHTSKV